MDTADSTADEKVQWCEWFEMSPLKMKNFCKQHDGCYRTFRKWYQQFELLSKRGIDTFHDKGGHPAALSEEECDELAVDVKNHNKAQKSLSRKQFHNAVNEKAVKTKHQRNIGAKVCHLSDKTHSRYLKKINGKFKQPQLKPTARVNAESDPINILTMVALARAFSEHHPPHMIFNWDATQYIVSSDLKTARVMVSAEDSDGKPLTDESEGKLDVIVKMYHFHNAAGYVANPVFIIADESMEEGKHESIYIPGLCYGSLMGGGYICFSKTRAGTNLFYKWFAEETVIPFINKCRNYMKKSVITLHGTT